METAPDRHCVSLSDNFGLSSKGSSALSASLEKLRSAKHLENFADCTRQAWLIGRGMAFASFSLLPLFSDGVRIRVPEIVDHYRSIALVADGSLNGAIDRATRPSSL